MVIANFNEIDITECKGILLDLDNTIYPYEPTHQAALEHCYQHINKIFPMNYSEFENKFKEAKNQIKTNLKGQAASHSRLLYFQNLFEMLLNRTNSILALEFEDLYWSKFLEIMQADPNACKFIKAAHEKGLKLGIVTDLTAQIQHQKIIKLELANYIDHITSSEEAGAEKPNPKIFEIALNKMKCKPEEVIMIGDDQNKDIKGAENLGIKAYQIELT